jgi:hypothetical protein
MWGNDRVVEGRVGEAERTLVAGIEGRARAEVQAQERAEADREQAEAPQQGLEFEDCACIGSSGNPVANCNYCCGPDHLNPDSIPPGSNQRGKQNHCRSGECNLAGCADAFPGGMSAQTR